MDRDEAARTANEYRHRLIAYVSGFMGPGMKRRLDPEDIVQSAMKSFFKQEVMPDTEERLIDLLYHFTEYKRKKRFRDALARKRDLRREQGPSHGDAHPELDTLLEDRQTGPVEAAIQAELTRLIERWWGDLGPEARTALELMAEGRTQAEIAGQLGVADRSVRRYLREAEGTFRSLLGLEARRGEAGGGSLE